MTKKECRQLFSEKRKALNQTQHELLSKQVIHCLIQSVDFSHRTVSLFLPIQSKQEINTWSLLDHQRYPTTQFTVPIADFQTFSLQHIVIEPNTQFITNRWGIPEPVSGRPIAPQDIDIVLVPLLAFDTCGFRVGYGKGFYDRFLANCKQNCVFVGLSVFEPIDTISDINVHDIPLHIGITPQKNIKFPQKNN